jgi:peptide/nickel transport system substrate-binding protein
MRRFRWQLIIILITGVIIGILFLGEQDSTETVQEPEPIQGGIYTEALIGAFQRLNPVLDFNNSVDRDVDHLIFSGLLKIDDRGLPQLDMAESWGINRDGTIYNFTLRPNALWHDGIPVTSNDILFTVELMREGSEVIPEDLRNFWQEIDVVALSEDSVQFRLPEAFAPFPDYLTFGILPAHLLADLSFEQIMDDPFNLHPIGSGPYRFDYFIVENDVITGVVLAAFEDYYNERAFIDQIVFRYYPDGASAFQAYRDDMVQGIGSVPDDILADVMTEDDLDLYTVRKPEMGIIFLNLNNQGTPFFQEPEIRLALLEAINRRWLIDRYLSGQGFIANGVILPNTWAYYDGLEEIGFDTEAAKLALKEAGYVVVSDEQPIREKEGILFEFELAYPDDEFHQALAESIQADWTKLEISVTLTPLPYEELIETRLHSRTYDAALVSLNLTGTPDPDPYPFWDHAQATGGQNYSQWENRTASDYLEEARITWDLAERARLYRNFQVIFQEEMPSLPLYFTVFNYAVDNGIQGVRVGPIFDTSDRFSTIADWFLVVSQPDDAIPAATTSAQQ